MPAQDQGKSGTLRFRQCGRAPHQKIIRCERTGRRKIAMRKSLLILAAAAATCFSAVLYADDYPSRPVTLVAVFGPGSASDTICRIIANKLGPALGQPVIVEDRPGADGALAALYVHHHPADGYTLMMATNSPLSADPYLHKDVNYDPVKDFVPITRVGSFTLMLVAAVIAAPSQTSRHSTSVSGSNLNIIA